MIGKDYFKRQAKTLRKMVGVTQDKTAVHRLTLLADDFEAKAEAGPDKPEVWTPAAVRDDEVGGRQ